MNSRRGAKVNLDHRIESPACAALDWRRFAGCQVWSEGVSSRVKTSIQTPLSAAGACVLVTSLVVSAFLMAFAVESPSHWWLGWMTLLPLFQAIRILTPLRAAACGALWGASLFTFAITATDTAASATLPSFLALTAIPAAYSYLGARLTAQVGFSPYLLALGWMGVELALRPLGLRHGLLAATVGDSMLLRLFGSLAGYVLVAFVVAYVNAALLTVLSGVCSSFSSSRLVRRAGAEPQGILGSEVLEALFHLIRPAQPRAPPVSV